MFDENVSPINRPRDAAAVDAAPQLDKAKFQPLPGAHRDENSWREEVNMWIMEVDSLRSQLQSCRAERDTKARTIDDLLKDQQSANSRISALIMEHREVKNHWLAEKADLQSRLCQVQALNTQIAGTMKKKEKDFDKLQTQLAKLVKDTSKAQKATIHITAPLKKSLSQDQSNPTVQQLLKDAEVLSLKSTIRALETENGSLKALTQQLNESLDQLQSSVALLPPAPAPAPAPAEPALSILPPSPPDLSCTSAEDGSKTFSEQAEDGAPPSAMTPVASGRLAVPGSIAKKYLIGTPGARPLSWVMDQANTEVKRLRERAEYCADNTATPSAYGKINSLRSKLAEAMAVIQEQDRLIHQALVGSLPTSLDNVVVWDIDEDTDDLKAIQSTSSSSASLQPSSHVDLDEMMKWTDSDFLPPASPDTIELLQTFGWASVPRIASAYQSRRTSLNKAQLEMVPEDCLPEKLQF